MLDNVLTSLEVSELFNVSDRYVRQLATKQKFKARKSGRTWLIDRETAEVFFNRKKKS